MNANPKGIEKDMQSNKDIISLAITFVMEADKTDNTELLDSFCELNFINEFIQLINLDLGEMSLTIIESFSFLLINLTNIPFLYYLFSNNFINTIISKDFSLYDDNFFSYYISFIKSLALRIDHTTIQFFYRANVNSFPLVQCALKVYNFNDSMIRTCVRTIILSILRIKHEPIQDYFVQLPTVEYFIFITLHLEDLILQLNETIYGSDHDNLQLIYEDIIDEMIFINDILSLHLEKINYALINSLFYHLIIPVLCESMITISKPKLSLGLCLFILKAFIDNIQDECFSNVLYTILFMDEITEGLTGFYQLPNENRNYCKDWKKQKALDVTFIDFISNNYSKGLMISLIYENSMIYHTKKYPQLELIHEKVKKDSEENINISPDEMEKRIHNYLELQDMKQMTDYHQSVCSAVGINVGILAIQNNTIESYDICILKEISKLFSSIISKDNKSQSKIKLVHNEIKGSLLSFLQSKDDTMIFLVNLLLYSAMNKSIPSYLTNKAQLININKKDSLLDIKVPIVENGLPKYDIESLWYNFNNAYFNQIIHYKQSNLNYHLIVILLLKISFDHPLRMITTELILLNIFNMLIDSTTLTLKADLSKAICHILKEIYTKSITHINQCIKTSYTIREKGFEYFKQVWSLYSTEKTPIDNLQSVISKPYCLLPSNLEETIKGYPIGLKFQTNDIEQFKYMLMMYMKFHDLNMIFFNLQDTDTFIKKQFPLERDSIELNLDQTYNLASLTQSAIMLDAKLKLNNMDSFDVVVVVYYSFIYFGFYDESKENKTEYSKIMFKYALRNVSIHKDTNDDKTILNMLIIEQGKAIELSLKFNNEQKAHEFNWNVSDKKLTVISNEKMQFLMHFQELGDKIQSSLS